MQKWEYKTYYYNVGDLDKLLSELGEQGWELIAVGGADDDGIERSFYFKRPNLRATQE